MRDHLAGRPLGGPVVLIVEQRGEVCSIVPRMCGPRGGAAWSPKEAKADQDLFN